MKCFFKWLSVFSVVLFLVACNGSEDTRKIIFMDGDEVLFSQDYVVGESLQDLVAPEVNKHGRQFFGWSDEIPSIMPDKDVILHAVWDLAGVFDYEIINNEIIILDYVGDLSELIIPDSMEGYPVVELGKGIFEDNTVIKVVTLPEGLRAIGNSAFRNSSIERIIIPSTVVNMGHRTFQDATGLTTVTFQEGSQLESLGESTFWNAVSLTDFEIPERVQSFNRWTFEGARSLTSIHIPAGVISIGTSPFRGASNLTSITVDEDNEAFTASNGVLFDKDMTTLMKFPEGLDETTYIVPQSVTTIQENAFSNAQYLTTVLFGEDSQVESFGIGAFQNAKALTSIHIPASVTSLGGSTFSGASALETVTFAKNSQLIYINRAAFQDTVALTNIEIPDGVTTLGSRAFEGANALTRIYIPASVTSMGSLAFNDTENVLIYTALASPPSGWHTDWNPLNRPVHWSHEKD